MKNTKERSNKCQSRIFRLLQR